MHEHIARTMYYFNIHLLYASIVACSAWALTSIRGGSATTKYWIWVATGLNFIVPVGALLDRLWAPHLSWASPLGAIGDPVWQLTEGRKAIVLAVVWLLGALAMATRLALRLRAERHATRAVAGARAHFLAQGVPVTFAAGHPTPAVDGVLHPRISLPTGIERVLSRRELDAVLLHELTHARRRDNLIRLVQEIALCLLWFHPLVWLAGSRMALYRELSCDESVIRGAHGRELVSALAKLAAPEQAPLLQASAASHISYRLERLVAPARPAYRAASVLLTMLFSVLVATSVFGTIAHTACCFVLKH
jgi:beta-lactamase regulating signal transducer with metallopeptidase domain